MKISLFHLRLTKENAVSVCNAVTKNKENSNRPHLRLTGNSLTEACYTTCLRTLIQQDPKLRGTPLRYAAISKLCELRIRAEKMVESLSREEVETCFKTKHVQLEKRLRNSAVWTVYWTRPLRMRGPSIHIVLTKILKVWQQFLIVWQQFLNEITQNWPTEMSFTTWILSSFEIP